jgi:glycogen debranching enzyme
VNHLTGTDFYHADWGGAVAALDAIAPDDAFAAEAYPSLARYADWLLATRDREGSGMVDVVDQYETGQEYMSRYQAVDPDADRYGWENRIRLKGVDVTVYAYSLLRCLERLAPRAAAAGDAGRWRALAERTAAAVRDVMWDAESEMFSDVNPASGARTGVKAAVCFYPYLTDVTGPEHVPGLERNLFDPAQFWTPFPVPSSSADDPLFSAFGEWKGKRHVCPWNGRVWPMTNSHVVEALARVAREHAPHLRPAAAALLLRFVHMLFDRGDVHRPTSYEHYNPLTGHGSVYRGVDDYQHSWVNDLILQNAAGVLPRDGGVTVDPLPLGLELVQATDVRVRGVTLSVTVAGDRVRVERDDAPPIEARLGTPIEIEL